jgi:hypothetical protein
MGNTLLIQPFLGMRSEISSLGLQQIVRQSLTSVNASEKRYFTNLF